jgi:predicted nucleic acid-binding protein
MLLDTNIVSAFIRRDAQTRTPKVYELVATQLTAQGLAVAFVTQFELRRGIEELVRRGGGRRVLVNFEKLMERVQVLGLDEAMGEGWNVAARLWAEGRSTTPALKFKDADLLIAATAAFHGHEFATSDVGLANGLARLAFPVRVQLVPVE